MVGGRIRLAVDRNKVLNRITRVPSYYERGGIVGGHLVTVLRIPNFLTTKDKVVMETQEKENCRHGVCFVAQLVL